MLKRRLAGDTTPQEAKAVVDDMTALAEREVANAGAAIPVVRADSRLGWEPSMGYFTDEAHLRWKIEHVRRVVDEELPAFRRSLEPGA